MIFPLSILWTIFFKIFIWQIKKKVLLYSYIRQCTLVRVVYIVCLYVYRNCTYFFSNYVWQIKKKMLSYKYIKQCTLVRLVYIVCCRCICNYIYFFYAQKKRGNPVTNFPTRLCMTTISLYSFCILQVLIEVRYFYLFLLIVFQSNLE